MKDTGFVMLVLIFALSAAFAAGVSLFTAGMSRPVTVHDVATAELRVRQIHEWAKEMYLRSGSFPASLDALATGIGVDPARTWRLDPFASGLDIDYQVSGMPALVLISSRGLDRKLGSADDQSQQLSEQILGRERTRGHLRLLRARFLNSSLMSDPGMAPAERIVLLQNMHSYALAQRQILFAPSAGKAALIVSRDLAASQIQAIRSSHGLPAIPSTSTGPGGLCEVLGIPDTMGVDGFGSLFLTGVVGFISAGGDRVGGSEDDL